MSKFFYFIRKFFYFDISLKTKFFYFSFILLGNSFIFILFYVTSQWEKILLFYFFMVISLSVISFILLGNSFILLGNSFILLGNYFIFILFGFYAFLCNTMELKIIWWWYYIFTMKSYYMTFSFLLLSITNFGKFLSPPPTVCSNGLYADISNQDQVQQDKSCLQLFL